MAELAIVVMTMNDVSDGQAGRRCEPADSNMVEQDRAAWNADIEGKRKYLACY